MIKFFTLRILNLFDYFYQKRFINFLKKNNFKQLYKSKMPFRKTFEYIYQNDSSKF